MGRRCLSLVRLGVGERIAALAAAGLCKVSGRAGVISVGTDLREEVVRVINTTLPLGPGRGHGRRVLAWLLRPCPTRGEKLAGRHCSLPLDPDHCHHSRRHPRGPHEEADQEGRPEGRDHHRTCHCERPLLKAFYVQGYFMKVWALGRLAC